MKKLIFIILVWLSVDCISCEFLVSARENTDKWLIISVENGGHLWGKNEIYPKFYRFKVADMTKEECNYYIDGTYKINNNAVNLLDYYVDGDFITDRKVFLNWVVKKEVEKEKEEKEKEEKEEKEEIK